MYWASFLQLTEIYGLVKFYNLELKQFFFLLLMFQNFDGSSQIDELRMKRTLRSSKVKLFEAVIVVLGVIS
jgi:hypothetical protein